MPMPQLSPLASLGAALLLVLVALMITSLLSLVLPFTPNITFVVAVVLSVLIGGIKAGAMSLLCSIVMINFFFIAPVYVLTPSSDDLWRLGLFTIVVLIAGLQRRSADQSHDLSRRRR